MGYNVKGLGNIEKKCGKGRNIKSVIKNAVIHIAEPLIFLVIMFAICKTGRSLGANLSGAARGGQRNRRNRKKYYPKKEVLTQTG